VGAAFSPESGVLLILVITFIVLVMPTDSGAPASSARRWESFPFAEQLRSLLQQAPETEFSDDFRSGLEGWTSAIGSAADGWAWEGTYARPAGLRLWKPTLDMTDYQLVFQGEIEAGAMSWAFRASGSDNHYATKLVLETASANHRSEISRYSMVDGEPQGRVALPLPFRIETGVPYEVRVLVERDTFSTTINGQVVDTWHDARHQRGGVGFFSDPGERALIDWVRVSDGQGFLDRLFSFSLLVAPHDLVRVTPR